MAKKRKVRDSSDRPSKPELSVDGDVQGDVNVAGRDIVQNKTIIQRIPLRIVGGALAVIVVGLIAVVVFNSLSSRQVGNQVNTVGTQVGDVNSGVATLIAPTALPFPAATGDEVLVIVADFTGESVDARIYNALRDRVAESGFTGVRVERLRGVAPETAEEAVAVGEMFNATLVIWGIADGSGIEPHYEVVSHQADIRRLVDLGVTPAFDQPSFSVYIVYGVSNEFEYLMLFSLGQIPYFNSDYDQSIELFDQAVSIDLGERQSLLQAGIAYFYRGVAHNENDELDAALADYSKAIEIDPELLAAYNNRGIIYEDLGDFDAALADFARAIEIDPEYAKAYRNRANVYFDQSDFDAALADCSKAIELEPDDATNYYNRGSTYVSLGEMDAALADYSKAIEIEPDNALGYSGRAFVYYKQGDFDAALTDYSKAIELDPEAADAYSGRGNVYYKQGDPDAALAEFSKAIEIDPAFRDPYLGRGNVYYDQGDFDAAVADYSKVIEIDPAYRLGHFNRGNTYYAQGNFDAALADYSKVIEIDPAYSGVYINRGNLYSDQGDLNAAVADYSKAIELDPDQPIGYHNRGNTLARLGVNLVQALDDLNRALELSPDRPRYLRTRSFIYYKLGKYSEGLVDATKAIDRGETFAYYIRGMIYQAQGKTKEAIADFTQYIKQDPEDVSEKDDARQRIIDMGGTPP